MKQNFSLKISANLPNTGFSLDELVIETKKMFETEGMVGFLRLLLTLLDYLVYLPFIGKNEKSLCCEECHLVVAQKEPKKLVTSCGLLEFIWTRLKCKSCGRTIIPLRGFLGLEKYQTKTSELEQIVAEVVSEQSFRRASQHLETIGNILVPHTRLHRWVMKSDCDEIDAKKKVQTIIGDGTGYKKKPVNGSNRGEVRLVVGVTKDGVVMPYGAWTEESWRSIGQQIKQANHPHQKIYLKPIADMLVTDGEPGMIRYLKKLANDHQRCMWLLPYELRPILQYQDGVEKDEAKGQKSELQNIIEIELPKEDFNKVPLEDKLELEKQTWQAEKEVEKLIDSFIEKGYNQVATYLLNAKKNMFSYVRTWLKTGLVNPRMSSMIERMMREIGRRIKKIGFGWSPEGAAKMTRIIIKRITSANEWDEYWEKRLKLTGKLKINFLECDLA